MPLPQERGLYVVSNFTIGFNNLNFKTTQHKYKLNFMHTTFVKEVKDPNFSMNMFVVQPFSELLSCLEVDEHQLFGELFVALFLFHCWLSATNNLRILTL